MKEKIIELITQSSERGLNFDEIKVKLNIESQDEYNETFNILNAFCADFTLALNKKNRYILAKYADIYVGSIRINKKGFGFVIIENLDDDVYIGANHIKGALDKDLIAIKRNASDNSGEIIAILKRGTTKVVGSVISNKRGKFMLQIDSAKITLPIFIEENTPNLVEGLKIKGEIIAYEKDYLIIKVEDIIGHMQDVGVDILSKLIEYDIYADFNDMIMQETTKIGDSVLESQIVGRRDLRDEFVCTIDGDDSKDFDDAISIKKTLKGYELGVHIADVSFYVTQNSALDFEAYKRGTSVYVVDRVVPMLPFQLSNGICSLKPNVDRLTLSCVMQFDAHGEVIDYEIFPSVINSKQRMTYNNVNKILEEDRETLNQYAECIDKFKLMLELSLLIRAKRYARGCIDFDTSESKFKLNENGKVVDIYCRERFEAERIIEDFMIGANECVAKHMRFLDLPFLYRIHEAPDPKRIREFAKISKILGFPFVGNPTNVYVNEFQRLLDLAKDSEEFPILSTFMLRCMSKARYDINCVGHFGLASENYTHFTSPIRRYPDLIVHRQLRKYLFDNTEANEHTIKEDLIYMNNCAMQSSERERAAVDAERDIESMKKAEFFETKINEVFEGIVTSVNNFGMFIELDNTVEGLVHISKLRDDYYHFDKERQALIGERTKNTYRLGNRVKIKVKGASKQEGTIDFELVENRKRPKQVFPEKQPKKPFVKTDNKVKTKAKTDVKAPFYEKAYKKSKRVKHAK